MEEQKEGIVNLPKSIETLILTIREHQIIIDADLAALYCVPTKALNQAIKRNADRFPNDFIFRLTKGEKAEVVTNCDHLVRLKFAKTQPCAFTEHGAVMAAMVLNSQKVSVGWTECNEVQHQPSRVCTLFVHTRMHSRSGAIELHSIRRRCRQAATIIIIRMTYG